MHECMGRHLPKVTPSFFAEFLDPLSPDRLGLLDLPTCVGLRYGNICVLLTRSASIMRLFSEAESDHIAPDCSGALHRSSIKTGERICQFTLILLLRRALQHA